MKTQADLIIAQNNLEQHRTSNVLHLLLSIITFGIWIPIWLLCALSNAMARGSDERAIRRALEDMDNK